jgi:hypothetical protein
MPEVDPILLKLDHLISVSRLHEIAMIMNFDRAERLVRLKRALDKLPAGAYLLGTGPSTVGIFPLTVDEVVLGRAATPLEEPSDTFVDYTVADTLYFTPHEVSRVHAKLVRQSGEADHQHVVVDLDSTCGTFVNGEQVEPGDPGRPLSHGDLLSLGPMQVSTYLYYVVAPEEPSRE